MSSRAALIVGLAFTASACDGGETPAAVPQPTVTVPGPAVTTTVTTDVTPDACSAAISAARDIAWVNVGFAEAVDDFPPYVERAFTAGLESDVDEDEAILEDMESSNEKIRKASDHVEPLIQEFNEQAADCEG